MSVIKNYTTDQLQTDLDLIFRQWPGGVPVEQNDRVNAIKNELKRRGAELRPPQPRAAQRQIDVSDANEPVGQLSDRDLVSERDQLARAISNDPGNDALQDRFADIRFELRQRAKAEPQQRREEAPPPTSSSSVQPRAIEIPDEVPTPMPTRRVPRDAEEMAQPARSAVVPAAVAGFTTKPAAGGVLLTYGGRSAGGANIVQLATMLSVDDAENFVAMVQAEIDQAKRMS